MRCKNTSGRALVVGGRVLPVGGFVDVSSRDPEVATHLTAGRLTRASTPPPARPAGDTVKEPSDD